MPFPRSRPLLNTLLLALAFVLAGDITAQQDAGISIEYPGNGTLFPPDISAPTILWRDAALSVESWSIDIEFGDGEAALQWASAGSPPRPGEIDRRAVSGNNRPPVVRAGVHSWTPDAQTWAEIKRRSVDRPATLAISRAGTAAGASRAAVNLRTSRDPVGAPIFYRDVPLMPSEVRKGVIKPLEAAGIPLIAWRLRNVAEPRSRLLLEGLHSCANCHSFSSDGKTMGMDVDGPENDKGTYAITPVAPRTVIRNEDVITWNSFPGRPPDARTIGFLSQISPDGQYAVSTVNEEVYVANFKDYRFLQVFYPTRGILAWYNRATGRMGALPGADDPRFVQTDAVWSPDGKYLVFARAEARDAYPPGRKPAEYANDPAETPIQYDLYRIPFNQGRGGTAEPIAGASQNGMSNTFPKVSPDGRWIVFVKCRNGQLMRPDSELYIVPAQGGAARRMRSNTALMNSWHSFSPNGRWLVFSSKSRSPYTQMFLTHLDEDGNDSPPVLIENATAPNRAVNLPEFVNIPPDGLLGIEAPAAEFYSLFDGALQLENEGRHGAAAAEWRRALALDPQNAKARTNLGIALWGQGARAEAVAEFRKAVELSPGYTEARNNLGVALVQSGAYEEAVAQFRAVLRANPDSPEANRNLGVALMQAGRPGEAAAHYEALLKTQPDSASLHLALGNALQLAGRTGEALSHWRRGIDLEPGNAGALLQLAWVLATGPDPGLRNGEESLRLARRAMELAGGRDATAYDTLAAACAESGRFPEALDAARTALDLARKQKDSVLLEALRARLALYEQRRPFRENPRR